MIKFIYCTTVYKNDEDFNKDLEIAKERIKKEEKYRNCVKNSKELYEFFGSFGIVERIC